MRRTTSGFTIVEVLVVVSIVGLLATISTVSFSSIKSRANDAERSSKITILAEALEKFYDENGEYPGCNAMSQAASVITTSTLNGVDLDVLATPTASTGTNSILSLCGDLPIGIDSYAYVGDSSEACLTGQGCTQFTLKYREESTGNIISLQSRRSPFVRAPETPTTTVTLSGANVLATITPVTCTSGTIQYGIRSRTNDGTWSAYSAWSSTTTATQVATQGIKYGYQAQARCWVSDSLTSWASTGLEGTYSHPVVTPAAPAIAVTLSGSNILATITPVSCSAGTAQYGIRSRTNDGSWSSYSAWSTGLTTTLPAVGATKYGFQAQARCYVSEFGISPTSTGAEGTYMATAPSSAPSIAVTSNGSTITGTITAVSCPVGTTTQYQIRSRTNDGSWSGWSSWSTTLTATQSASQGVKYGYQAQSRCYISDYAYSTTSTGSEGTYVQAINAPAAPSIAVTSNGSTITGTITAVSCPVGTTTQYQIRSRTNDGSWSGWSSWSTTLTATRSASQGVKYGYQAQSRCYSDYAYSTTSTGSEGTYVQGINVPAAPSVWNSTPNWADTNYGWGGSSCPSGTTLLYAYYYWRADGWNSGWIETGGTSASYSTSHFGWWYNLQAMARCYSSYTTSGWSGANSTSFTRPGPPSVNALVVGGGGSGGWGAGGGGGGGYVQTGWQSVWNGGIGATVGGGGGRSTQYNYNHNGGSSNFINITSQGGGAGGSYKNPGLSGSSGGGGAGAECNSTNSPGAPSQGYWGGYGGHRGTRDCPPPGTEGNSGGGGGGAGGGGYNYNVDPKQRGGAGVHSDMDGNGRWYGGGGGGGGWSSSTSNSGYWGYGDPAGGGNGCINYFPTGVGAGASNTGGGGGGGENCTATQVSNGCGSIGWEGGSGKVVIRYPSAWWWGASGGNSYGVGSDWVHVFDGSGTFTVWGW